VSEIMLQQTTVSTVLPRYQEFLDRFPDVQSLAAATEEDVLSQLEGMGYYRRFRAMKKAAEIVARDLQGVFPHGARSLMELPGIGEYTAGAIASIAQGQAAPAVDGNVLRVVARLAAIKKDVSSAAGKFRVTQFVAGMMAQGVASLVTQSLFDLGAQVCKPRDPKCEICPLNDHCKAYQNDLVARLPILKKRRAAVPMQVAVAWIKKDNLIALRKRADSSSRMPGFWELPEIWLAPDDDGCLALEEHLRDENGCKTSTGPGEIATASHTITHHRLHCRLFESRWIGSKTAPKGLDFVERPQDINGPISTITKKLLRAVDMAFEDRAGN